MKNETKIINTYLFKLKKDNADFLQEVLTENGEAVKNERN